MIRDRWDSILESIRRGTEDTIPKGCGIMRILVLERPLFVMDLVPPSKMESMYPLVNIRAQQVNSQITVQRVAKVEKSYMEVRTQMLGFEPTFLNILGWDFVDHSCRTKH